MMYPNVPNLSSTNSNNFFLIAGPCVIENKQMPYEIAEKLLKITSDLNIPFIFKASYKKANRSRMDSFVGIGDWEALEILKDISKKYKIPVVTDVHNTVEAEMAAQFVDILQIPAFLCRQTELLVAAAKTGKPVSVKKGQFLSPEAMRHAVDKIRFSKNENIMLVERGNSFGYQDLVVDFRGVSIMQENKVPVVVDITHSLQKPNQPEGISGGYPKHIETIGKAAVAVGADGVFIETHPEPVNAKSDGANMLPLYLMENMLQKLVRIREAVK